MNKTPCNNLEAFYNFRKYFDNSKINSKTIRITNDFIFRCLNEDGPPLCIREAISNSGSDFKNFRSSQAYIDKLAVDDMFLANLSVDIVDRNSQKKALLHVECIIDTNFGETVGNYLLKTKSKPKKLIKICENLKIDKSKITDIPYSLLKRFNRLFVSATLKEADYNNLIFAIHSFGQNDAGFEAFKIFSKAMGMKIIKTYIFSSSKEMKYNHDDYGMEDCDQYINARLIWVNDKTFVGLDSSATATNILNT